MRRKRVKKRVTVQPGGRPVTEKAALWRRQSFFSAALHEQCMAGNEMLLELREGIPLLFRFYLDKNLRYIDGKCDLTLQLDIEKMGKNKFELAFPKQVIRYYRGSSIISFKVLYGR